MMSLSEDQYRFLIANAVGIGLATQYRFIPKALRNGFHSLPGILMVYYCFGKQAHSLIIFSGISYLICKYSPWKNVQYISLISSLAFLSHAHLTRQILDYGGYVLDISGPFMIAVQKMTSLGFCLHDGGFFKALEAKHANSSQNIDDNYDGADDLPEVQDNINSEGGILSPSKSPDSSDDAVGLNHSVIKDKSRQQRILEERKELAVGKVPSFCEFMGFFFHFPSVLCGPIVYYNDYLNFINQPQGKSPEPGRWMAAAKKLSISVGCAILHLSLNPMFDVTFLRTEQFQVHSPVYVRFGYILVLTMLARLKYYVAWHLGEVISNVSGLGFNGYDFLHRPKWDLLSNMDLWKFETCLSMRDAIIAWNKTTQTWLRRTAYDRVPKKLSVLATYVLSALWHGFYPGYYLTFLGGAIFTIAARNGRRVIRPMFQQGVILPRVYDTITFILTRLTIAYAAFPFVILDFKGSYDIYRSLYFSIHVISAVGLLIGLVA